MKKLENAILNQMVGQEVTANCEVCNEELKMVITKNKTIRCKRCNTEYPYEAELDKAIKAFEKMGIVAGK